MNLICAVIMTYYRIPCAQVRDARQTRPLISNRRGGRARLDINILQEDLK